MKLSSQLSVLFLAQRYKGTDESEGDAMKKLLVIVFAAFAFALLGDDVVYQDEDVRRTLSMSCCVIDNSGKINRMRNHALSVQCGNDTNRFVRTCPHKQRQNGTCDDRPSWHVRLGRARAFSRQPNYE